MKNKTPYIVIFSIFLGMLIIGSFLDFQINSALFSNTDPIALFFSAVGEYPGYGVLAFMGGYLIISSLKFIKKPLPKILLIIGGIISWGSAIYFQGNAITNINGYNMPQYKWVIGVPIALVILSPFGIAGILVARKVKNKNLWQIAFVLALACAIAIGLINLLKPIMNRPRFRWLITQDEIAFHNWWEPFSGHKNYISSGVNKDQFKSYPSGHVGTACFMLAIPFVPILAEGKITKLSKTILFSIAGAYALFLAFIRMRVGAHFMSDIATGGLISCILHITANEIILKLDKRYKFNL